jgi:glycerol-3-phosphate acyltransferase PlsY
MEVLAAIVTGYLLGSIPFGLIVSRLAGGVDVRDFGSGKTGFTNSLRVLGLKRSLPVFLGDVVKGAAAALLPLLYSDDPWARAAGGLAAVVGHIWPVFARFRGGRGVLTGAGVLFALSPVGALAAAPVAIIAFLATRIMSIVSISAATAAALAFVVLAALDHHAWAYAVAAVSGASLIIAVHHDNIARLSAGTEPKIGSGGTRRVVPASEP